MEFLLFLIREFEQMYNHWIIIDKKKNASCVQANYRPIKTYYNM